MMYQGILITLVYLVTVSLAITSDSDSATSGVLSVHQVSSHRASSGAQVPMNPDPAQSHFTNHEHHGSGDHNNLTISDILPKTRGINIFASLTRDVSSVSDHLESLDNSITLLAPLNSVMQNLPRKPWEDRPGSDGQVSAANNQEKAMQNLQRFVEEHLVPICPWRAGKEHKIKTIGGQELWWEERSGIMVILPGEIIVDKVFGGVGNGEVWTVKGVVNYA